ncbi:hypothetical protein LTS18_007226 [Coniosporium uncinatum]|uniref:Uncharacterized protein n=1 Tax=Coniosporium uncinatum TaxID=93489 RepID=A0ACC3DX56_9PEZI|nr:hypothetical protein LTS18_007226 [Coniosporium uncinatum]
MSLSTSISLLHTAESSHPTYDLAIKLHHQGQPPQRTLRLLIFTPTTLNPSNHDTTLARIQHFAALTGGRDIAVIFLLAPQSSPTTDQSASNATHATPMHAYSALQVALFTASADGRIPSIPVLPCPAPTSLPKVLQAFTDGLASAPAQIRAVERKYRVNAALDLLPHCTVDGVMREEASLAMTDLFADLRGVVRGALEGEGSIEREFGEAAGVGAVEFWREEWVNE